MANNYFIFKQFTVHQEHAIFKITTDSVLLGAWAGLEGARHVLDAGTGTGILALMAAQRCDANIVAIEPDRTSFMQAGLNITASPWHNRIMLINSTLQDYNPDNKILFDVIITNPPFFVNSLLNPDRNKAAARHSLTLSHDELIAHAVRLLAPAGALHLVLPASEAEQFISMAKHHGLSCQRRLNVKPTPSVPPVRVLMTLGQQKREGEENIMVIEKGGRHHYSDEYVSLTKDFYLKF
jgi:tRNA1Val (adenine37-N6)-methyltransferase